MYRLAPAAGRALPRDVDVAAADHLLARGEEVIHIMGPGKEEPATMSAGAVTGEDGSVTYPAEPAH